MAIVAPADFPIAGVPAPVLILLIVAAALCLFSFIMFRRIELLKKGKPDDRFSKIGERIWMMIAYGFGQFRQPRYPGAGILHILLFAGFVR
jgi:hypothetical protein